jgi:purine-cytosine permease-like protein
MTSREQPARLELSTIQPIPASERHGTAGDLFTVWFGSNLMLLTIVTGGLAVTVFALPFGWAAAALAVGNLIGAVFMALHAAQGPTLGVPQMIQTRGQFGSLGSLLVVGIVLIMYVGFLSSNLVLGGEALASLVSGASDVPGIALVGVLSVIAAIFGYDLIHAYTRWMTYVSGLVLGITAAWIIWVHGLPADFLQRNEFNWSGFLGSVSAAALWQIAYAPYVSDYSRYMPQGTGSRPAFWASYWGCTLGSLLPMVLGAVLGKAAFLVNYEHFILLLLYVLVPWTAINLVDYYLLRHGVYDVPSFFRQDGGIYGRINVAAVTCYGVGILVQLPFIDSALFTGPVARAMGGIDLSWIVGLAVTSPAYYWMAKRSQTRGESLLARDAG